MKTSAAEVLKALGIFGILLSPLVLGYLLSWIDFTYGATVFDPAARGRAWALIAALIGGGMLFEWLFRRNLLAYLQRRFTSPMAIGLHLALLNLVFAVPLVYFGRSMEAPGPFGFWLYENVLQLVWTLVYLRTGSVVLTGLMHGMFSALRFVALNEISSPFETFYFYSCSHPAFFILLIAVPALLAAHMAYRYAMSGPREPEKTSILRPYS